jgi:hypothetical protein
VNPVDAESAAHLVAFGMRPKLVPARDPAYAELVRRYTEDDGFKDLVNRIASGLGLVVLAVGPQSGVVVAATEESVFEIRMDEYARRTTLVNRQADKVLHGLAHLAVAALAFPRPDDLGNDSYVGRVSVDQVDAAVREACRVLQERVEGTGDNADPLSEAPELEAVWRAYARRPPRPRTAGPGTPPPAASSARPCGSWPTRGSWCPSGRTAARSAPRRATRCRSASWPPGGRSTSCWSWACCR